MVKLVATIRHPPDPRAWMNHFLTVHEPLWQQAPGLRRIELASPFDTLALPGQTPDRRGAPFLIAEVYFDDRSAFDHAMTSDVGRAILEDLQGFAGGLVTLYLAEVDRDHVVSGDH